MYDFYYSKRCRFIYLVFFLLICLFNSSVAGFSEEEVDEHSDNYIKENVEECFRINSTYGVKNIYRRARVVAEQLFNTKVNIFHLAYAIFEEENGVGNVLAKSVFGESLKLQKIIAEDLINNRGFKNIYKFQGLSYDGSPFMPLGKLYSSDLKPDDDLIQLHIDSVLIAQKTKSSILRLDHIIMALSKNKKIQAFFKHHNVPIVNMLIYLESQKHAIDDSILNRIFLKYGKDLTALAKKKMLSPVFGRDKEIINLTKSLFLLGKNNVILIGEPGVGKTAVVEGLAMKIVDNDVPEALQNKVIISIDLMALMSGTSLRGELESRIEKLFDAADKTDNVILFIDEIHLITTGSKDDNVDTSDMIKRMLDRPNIRVIGATTLQEYSRFVRRNRAFTRLFKKIVIDEASKEASVEILRGLRPFYEAHHGIRISDNAIVAAVNYASKYMQQRYLPDKAIDVIDTACSMVRLQLDARPERLDYLEKKFLEKNIELSMLQKEKDRHSQRRKHKLEIEIDHIKEELITLRTRYNAEKAQMNRIRNARNILISANNIMNTAVKRKNQKAVEYFKSAIPKIENYLKEVEENCEYMKDDRLVVYMVNSAEVATVISKKTGIPVTKLTEDEKLKLLNFSKIIKEKVVGQDSAVESISKALINSRLGLSFGKRPVGVFLLLGCTGVGKTLLAKTIAEELYNDQKFLLRFDMSEYATHESINRLIGTSPGYVGYREGGQLTEALRKTPNAVVLFDEFEKAHSKIVYLLLQVFGDARLTDGEGNTIDCSNAVFIMTSNLGSDLFDPKYLELEKEERDKKMLETKKNVLEKAREFFPTEFINRLDKIEVFQLLDKAHQKIILEIVVSKFSDRLEKLKDAKIKIDNDALEIVFDACFNYSYGARPLVRFVDYMLGVQLSRISLRNSGFPEHSYIYITKYDSKLENKMKEQSIEMVGFDSDSYSSEDSDYNGYYTKDFKDLSNSGSRNDLHEVQANSIKRICQTKKINDVDDCDVVDDFLQFDFSPIVGKLMLAIYDKNDVGEPNMNKLLLYRSFVVRKSDLHIN